LAARKGELEMRASRFAVLGLSALALAACKSQSTEVDVLVYETVEACVAGERISEKDCQTFYASALELHDTSSPDYPTRAECEGAEGVGSCEKLIGDRYDRRHRPALVAFMVPVMPNAVAQPIYRAFDTQFSYRTATNIAFSVSDSTHAARLPLAAAVPPTSQTAVRAGVGGIVSKTPPPAAGAAAGSKTAAK